jgi:tetratricopeptide (TPR) repeat protein
MNCLDEVRDIHAGSTSMNRFHLPLLTPLLMAGTLVSCAGFRARAGRKGTAGDATTPLAEPGKGIGSLQAYRDFALASLYEGEGSYEKAKDYLGRAIENDPDSVFDRANGRSSQGAREDYQEALSYAQKAVALDPRKVESRLVLADLYILVKDDESAIRRVPGGSGDRSQAKKGEADPCHPAHSEERIRRGQEKT